MKVGMMSHDLMCVVSDLESAARRYTLPHVLSAKSSGKSSGAADLATAAVLFTIQLAIESGRDPVQMRALESDLLAALQKDASSG